jgi:hypothetical protein
MASVLEGNEWEKEKMMMMVVITYRPCMVPCKNCADMAVVWGFCIDLGTRSMLITAQTVPFSMSLEERKTFL